MQTQKSILPIVILIALMGVVAGFYCYAQAPEPGKNPEPVAAGAGNPTSVELTDKQLASIAVAPVQTHVFHTEKEVLGSVAYHEKDIGAGTYMVANIPESDSPAIHVGQPVHVRLAAYPGRVFDGKITVLGVTVYDSGGNPAVDPNTHRITARCAINDPHDELYPGMLGSITIDVGEPAESAAVPENGVVREGDGTMSAWVTRDHHRFTRRVVKVGLKQDGYDEITEGLQPGEQAVTNGAVFLSNILYGLPSD